LAERHKIGLVVPTVNDLLALDDVKVVFILSRHESHAGLVVQALDAGKHVFVEKPLALSEQELEAVKASHGRNEGHLVVGFNRRYSVATVTAQKILEVGSGPLAIDYRVNAGRLPESHWQKDRRQGGRIIGEVCHFIDVVSWLVGRPPDTVHAVGPKQGEIGLQEEVAVLLGYPDGSMATVTYAAGGHPAAAKERLEVMGRGHTVLIDDFRRLVVDNKVVRGLDVDKGHEASLTRLRRVLQSPVSDDRDLQASYSTSEVTLRVIHALLS